MKFETPGLRCLLLRGGNGREREDKEWKGDGRGREGMERERTKCRVLPTVSCHCLITNSVLL